MPIQYDIDALLESPDFPSIIRGKLPDAEDELEIDPDDSAEAILPEERVLRDIGEFYDMSGNGFSTLVDNENYDIIDRSFEAALALPPTLLLEGLSELKELLKTYDFPDDPALCVEFRHTLSDEDKAELEVELDALDKKFFYNSDHQHSLWNNLDYLDKAREYARNNLDVLRRRKS